MCVAYFCFFTLCMVTGISCELNFPPGFKFGAATAAYQVEGAWNLNGRTPSLWDEYVHTKPHMIEDRSSGDVACDSYHLWKRDVEIALELGLDFYRFSISWTRLFPNGFTNHVNEDGRRYYSDLIDALIDKGIEPVVTLYHWDLPHKFQELGGWTNPLIVDWFADYARSVFSLYANRVKTWITINEPMVLCDMVYSSGWFAPAILSAGVGNYICTKNVLLAHAKAWRIYDEEFRSKYKGKVAITNHHIWYEPADAENQAAAEHAQQLLVGIYTHPIYSKSGGWPPVIEKIIRHKSHQEGYKHSRLPAFTDEEKELVKGTYDFYGFNYYTSRLAKMAHRDEKIGLWPLWGSSDLNITVTVDPNWKVSTTWWLYVYPKGLRRQLKWFKDQFGDVEILITENGYADMGTVLYDPDRINYYKEHLTQVLLSIYEDGVRVVGYTAWSLMDNFEWSSGYTAKFGLYQVDFNSPHRERTPRASAHYYAAVIEHNSLNFTFAYNRQRGLYKRRTFISILISALLIIAII